jgi:DNA-directed RNA polymerase specialized sigma24 family protein
MPEQSFARSYRLTVQIAGFHAASTASLNYLPADMRCDLMQEGLMELWRKRARFDERRGCWRTFAERAIANKMRSLMRCYRCQLRNESYFSRREHSAAAPYLHIDLSLDVRRVLAAVSRFDRAVALSLCEHSTIETSRRLCVSRSTIYLAVERLRIAFVAAGFSEGAVNHRQ